MENHTELSITASWEEWGGGRGVVSDWGEAALPDRVPPPLARVGEGYAPFPPQLLRVNSAESKQPFLSLSVQEPEC